MLTDGKGLAEDGNIVGNILIERDKLVNADLGVFGKAAVNMDAEKLQVLADPRKPALAGGAVSAGDDGVHEHALTKLELALVALWQALEGSEYFMAEDGGNGGGHVLAAVNGDIGAAYARKLDLDKRLILVRDGNGDIAELEIEPIL